MLSFILSVLAGVFCIFYLWAKWKHSYWQRRGVPSLPTNFIFGNFMDSILGKIAPGYLLGRLYREAPEDAPFVGVYIMHQPFLLLRSPDLMKQIYVKDFHVFFDRYFGQPINTHDRIGSRGLFSLKNPEWRYLRTKLSPAFTSGKLKSLFELMVESAETLHGFMDKKFVNANSSFQTFDLKDASSRYTTDVISSLAFGIKTNSFDEPPPEFYTRSRYPFIMTLRQAMELFTVFFFPQIIKYLRITLLGPHADYFRGVFRSAMHARENMKTERGDVIDALLKIKHEKTEEGIELDDDTLAAQSVIFFVAGLETSSSTMAFALWELAKHQEIQQRVRLDILDHLDENKKFTYESIQEMKYLMGVINETLRFYPPAPLIDRVASQDYKIPGTNVVLEKGTVVYTALPGIQMDPKYHPEPEVFDPERFSDDRKINIKPCTFMPFGEGPRICIGLRVGMLQTAVGLITILRDHEVSLNPNYHNAVSLRSPFTAPANGIFLNVKKIST